MLTRYVTQEFTYDGSQLRPLFAYQEFQMLGESLVAWQGPCCVANEHMKDGEDLFAGESIAGQKMLHFILELFEQPLLTMLGLQRLLAAMAQDILQQKSQQRIVRRGDDLYWEEAKLSISIASRGAVSSMIHFAINVTNEGTPVKTACLQDLNIDPKGFAEELLGAFASEYMSMQMACKKVFPL